MFLGQVLLNDGGVLSANNQRPFSLKSVALEYLEAGENHFSMTVHGAKYFNYFETPFLIHELDFFKK